MCMQTIRLDEKSSTIENLIRSSIHSDICKSKVLESKRLTQPKSINDNIKLLSNDLEKSYGLKLDDYSLVYLASIENYILDKKDALVVSAWLAYSIKSLFHLNSEMEISRFITIQLLKNIPLLSKEMLINLWCESISNYCFDKIEYKHSLHYSMYAC